MPRPERALPPVDDPVVRFAAALRRLREEAGKPTYRVLGRRAHYSPTALAVAAGGHKLPSLAVTQAFVRACGGDVAEWTARWRQIASEPTDDPNPDMSDTGAPYLGLTAFQARDADRFFGRDNLTTELLDQVRQRRFVGVFGASGSGKSSVLRAGLVAKTDELAVVFTPGPHPMEECAVQLAALTDTAASSLRAEIAAGPGNLHLRIRQAMVDDERDLLLVVDQFEELFTLCGDENERAGFITALTTAASAETSRVRIVLGVRADFYGHCGQYPELVDALRGGQVLIGPMSVDELREAITAPAIRTGCKVETALVARVTSEAAGQPGVLPLVSHALLETWRRRHGILLTVTGYDAVGGIHQAIARTAETVFTTLDADQQRLAREIFLRLTALGEGTEDTKRRTHQSELDTSDPDTVLVLERLTRARLVFRDRDTVEIAHEALIRCWPRLRNWLNDDREGLRLHRQLTEAAAVWTSLDRDPGALYRGTRLAQVRDWADSSLSARERDFLAASLTEEAAEHTVTRRRARRLRRLAFVLAALLILTTTSMIIAVQAQNSISDQRNTALAQRVADQATALRPADSELAVQLSLAAYRLAPNPHTRSSLLSTLPRSVVSHSTEVYAVAFSVGGQTLATGGGDNTARLWNVNDPRHPEELAALTGHRGAIRAVAFSPDGRTLATSGDDHTARLWNVNDPRHPVDLATFDGHTDAIYGLAFSPDGRILATGSDDHTVRLWNVDDTQHPMEPAIITGPTDSVDVVAFSPDGRTLATGGDDEAVRLWNVADPRHPAKLATLTDTAEVYAVAFSPDGRTLATAGDDHAVRLWNVADPRRPTELATLTGHTDSVEWVAFSPDGRILASSGDDHAVRLWNVADPRRPTELATLTSHTDSTDAVAFSPDGRTVATGSDDHTTQLFDTNFEQVIAHACDSIRSPITETQWNRYFPDLSYQPPCAD